MNKLAILLISLMVVACSSPTPPAPSTSQSNNQTNNSSNDAASTSAASPTPATSTEPTAAASIATASSTAAPTAEAAATTSSAMAPAASTNLANELQTLHNESIYFDFDESIVKSTFREILEKQASNYKSHANEVLVFEGNADERGSVAYNLALGERRATSVKKALVQLGVPAANTKVVSFGNTRPKLTCHEEKCWQENRRVDFTYK